jgi:hypothetical protein
MGDRIRGRPSRESCEDTSSAKRQRRADFVWAAARAANEKLGPEQKRAMAELLSPSESVEVRAVWMRLLLRRHLSENPL